MRVVTLPESWRSRALVVTGVEEPERWLTLDDIPTFRLEKQRTAWMLSRIAGIELARTRGAAESLIRSQTLSFSHAGAYGAAAIGDGAIGIDIEVPRFIPAAAAHLFLSDDEIATVEQCELLNALLHFWCAKEAAWKLHGGTIPTLKKVPLRLLAETKHGLTFERVETFAGEVYAALAL
ncbi:MAG: hypothetical protein JWO56_3398 [Acidobacteria bacterium]|nr:hypothetical protein [Acidobacteriota bacterium]